MVTGCIFCKYVIPESCLSLAPLAFREHWFLHKLSSVPFGAVNSQPEQPTLHQLKSNDWFPRRPICISNRYCYPLYLRPTIFHQFWPQGTWKHIHNQSLPLDSTQAATNEAARLPRKRQAYDVFWLAPLISTLWNIQEYLLLRSATSLCSRKFNDENQVESLWIEKY